MNLMQNEEFKKIVSEVDTDWPIEERIRYVLQKLEICDEAIIHMVTEGVQIENLSSYTLWQGMGLKENFHSKSKELFLAINDFIRNHSSKITWTVEERTRDKLQELRIRDKTIIRIIIAGANVANLYEHTPWEKSEFPQDFHQELKELSSSINGLIKDDNDNDDDSPVGILTFITTLQRSIMKDDEIKEVVCLFH